MILSDAQHLSLDFMSIDKAWSKLTFICNGNGIEKGVFIKICG